MRCINQPFVHFMKAVSFGGPQPPSLSRYHISLAIDTYNHDNQTILRSGVELFRATASEIAVCSKWTMCTMLPQLAQTASG